MCAAGIEEPLRELELAYGSPADVGVAVVSADAVRDLVYLVNKFKEGSTSSSGSSRLCIRVSLKLRNCSDLDPDGPAADPGRAAGSGG